MQGFRVNLRLGAGFALCLLLPATLPATSATAGAHRRPQSASTRPRTLDQALETAARRPPATQSGVSIVIADLETGQAVFERNPQQPETIASVTKLFSTAAAIHFLGPNYKFKTTLWRRGEIQDGTLLGSLLVVGRGDPNISGRFYDDDYYAVFDRWAEGLVKAGILRVAGDLILNTSFFDSVGRHPEWPEGQEARWYQAPTSALSYNDNVIVASVRPGPKPGGRAIVSIEPQTDILRPISWTRTVRRGRAHVAVGRPFGSGDVTVSGIVPSHGVWWSAPVAIDDPAAFFGSALRNRMHKAGISTVGQLVEKAVPPDNSWILVAETQSELLPTLAVTNKRSQGFYAEQVFKTLAAEKTAVGSWPNALAVQKEFLAAIGLEPSRYDLHDGSGLSPRNRVAAEDVVRFLRAMNAQAYGTQWKETLAVSGELEGTLRHRLCDPLTRGRVVAKTGSILNVSTLAGYLSAASGKTYAFAILLNGPWVWDTNGHAYQDRLVRALIKNG